MPTLKRADAAIYYEVHGAGFPIVLYAPGGLKSEVGMWGGASPAYPNGFPWIHARRSATSTPSLPWTSATPADRRPT